MLRRHAGPEAMKFPRPLLSCSRADCGRLYFVYATLRCRNHARLAMIWYVSSVSSFISCASQLQVSAATRVKIEKDQLSSSSGHRTFRAAFIALLFFSASFLAQAMVQAKMQNYHEPESRCLASSFLACTHFILARCGTGTC